MSDSHSAALTQRGLVLLQQRRYADAESSFS